MKLHGLYAVNYKVNAKNYGIKTVLPIETADKSKGNKAYKSQITCYRCKKIGHGTKTCIWDANKSHIKCHTCGLFGHLRQHCTNSRIVKTSALIQYVQNVNVATQIHDPSYEKYTHYGHVNNRDGSNIPIKILRDSGSIISLISSECVKLCANCNTNETMFIKGITNEIVEVPIIFINYSTTGTDLYYNFAKVLGKL